MKRWQRKLELYRPMELTVAQWITFVACTFKIEPKSVVEIGVYSGDTSKHLLRQWPHVDLYLVDPWGLLDTKGRMYKKNDTQAKWDKIAEKVARKFEAYPNVHILRMTSDEAVDHVPDGIDLVFIDGLHTFEQVTADIRNWLPKINRPGILMGDDFGGSHRAVKQAVKTELGRDIWVSPKRTWVHLVE